MENYKFCGCGSISMYLRSPARFPLIRVIDDTRPQLMDIEIPYLLEHYSHGKCGFCKALREMKLEILAMEEIKALLRAIDDPGVLDCQFEREHEQEAIKIRDGLSKLYCDIQETLFGRVVVEPDSERGIRPSPISFSRYRNL